jgi:ribonucleoside-diphosphate reductase alpha chain
MNTDTYGPQTQAADELHAMKYRGPSEDFREAMNRVAFGLKDGDKHYHELRQILLHQRFCPGGRIQGAIGASREVTAYNCFVSGTIHDSFVSGQGSIMQRATEAASTMRMGGGIGYDFSTLRPRGDLITKLQSQSSGPVSFMHIFDSVCLATSSSGHRRGAQMGIMRIDHPDIEEFIRAKQDNKSFLGFNISIGVTDDFMSRVQGEQEFPLTFNNKTYRTVNAAELWEKVMRSTWDYAEPGVIFIDTINKNNNLWYCEQIAATNPCGEQPLPPFGACLLGSFNLVKYLRSAPIADITSPRWYFDYELLLEDIPSVVRGLDNVIDRTRYPLAEQRAEALSKRRMGIGVMGLANAIEACGFLYGTEDFLNMEENILQHINLGCYSASADLAREKGSFPLFDAERYLQGQFIKTLPEEVRYKISQYGLRNSHLTSIAPTGTISMCADNVSGGIEPVFSYSVQRQINTPSGPQIVHVKDYGAGFLGVRGKLASQVTATEHVRVLARAQKHVDSAVSKTVNMTSAMPWQDFKDLYYQAWILGCKGCATFNSDGKRGALLVAKDETQGEDAVSCLIVDPTTGQRECG